jgi:putative ABC transport system permease protein
MLSKELFSQFKGYRLQSILIIVATALGVSVVTATLAAVEQLAQNRNELWQREITVQAKANDQGAFYDGARPIAVREIGFVNEESVELTLNDLQTAKAASPSISYAYITTYSQFNLMLNDGNTILFDVDSITEDYLKAANIKVVKGSSFTEGDFHEQRKVILLNGKIANLLGIQDNPIGKEIKVSDFELITTYTVIGIIEGESEKSGGFTNSLIPYKPQSWEGNSVQQIIFAVADESELNQARSELRTFAEKTWGERVTVTSQNNAKLKSQQRLMAIVIGAFASIGLTAASLNVMNLMLARVLKRQHDIGIRRSLGATRNNILLLFILESLVLGVLGGILGIAAGYGLFSVYSEFQSSVSSGGNPPPLSFPLSVFPLSFVIAICSNFLFSIYPAWQASRLNPVEALREG